MQSVGDHRSRRVRSHTTRIRTLIVVTDTLVILRGRQGDDPFPIYQDVKRHLFTVKKLF
jgi:hypothetical protein